MKYTIANLWNGNIAPCERCGTNDPEIKELIARMVRNKENLNQELTPHQQVTFEKYIDCSEEYIILMLERAFSDGFCMASRLLTEALAGNM